MSHLPAATTRAIEYFAAECFNALVQADAAVMRGDSDAADGLRAIAAYWSGRVFAVLLLFPRPQE